MKHLTSISVLATAVLMSGIAIATDYSGLTTEELSRVRGTLQNATDQERDAFRTEWQSRVQNMTQDERQQYAGRPENAGQGQKQMIRQRQRIHQQSATQSRSYGAAGSGAAASGGKGYGTGGGRGRR